MVQRGDDTASGAARLAVLEKVELLVRVGRGKRGEHEVVRILEVGVGPINGGGRGGRGGRGRRGNDAKLHDGRRIDGAAVGWMGWNGMQVRIGRYGTRNGRTLAAYAAHAGLGDGEHSGDSQNGEDVRTCLGCWRTVSSYSLCVDIVSKVRQARKEQERGEWTASELR